MRDIATPLNVTEFFDENAFFLFHVRFDNVFVECIVVRRFQDRFEQQAEVFGCLFKHLTFSTPRGDQMPNGHISAPNPKLVSPVLRAGPQDICRYRNVDT